MSLDRFVERQDELVDGRSRYDSALAELRAGRKVTHWMWFVFPQLDGVVEASGHQPTGNAVTYAIASIEEAREYLAHPVLGARLRECASAMLGVTGRSAAQILGEPDVRKLRSSMTLFHLAAPEEPVFGRVLDRYYEGQADRITALLLADS